MIKTYFKKMINEETGSGLVLALMVLLVLSVLGAALGVVTVGSYQLGDINRDSNSAYYIAEAGANMAYEEMEKYVSIAYKNSEISTDFFNDMKAPFGTEKNKRLVTYKEEFDLQVGNQPEANVHVKVPSDEGEEREYIIVSTGKIAGKTRTVEKPIVIKWIDKSSSDSNIPSLLEDAALISNGKIVFQNHHATVIGNILYSGPSSNDIFKGITHHGLINPEGVKVPEMYKEFPKEPEGEIEVKNGYSNPLTLTKNTKINNLTLNKTNLEIIVDTDEDIYLIVDELNMDHVHGSIKISGSGNLIIYVKDKLSLEGNNVNGEGDSSKLAILFAGTKKVHVRTDFKLNGLLYLKQAPIEFNPHIEIKGAVVSGKGDINMGNKIKIEYSKTLFTNTSKNDSTTEIELNDLISTQPATEQ